MPRSKQCPSGPLLLRGSLITFRRKCGKPSCSCAKGAPHQTPALSYSVRGVTQMLYLRRQDVREVRAALRRYNKALGELEKEALGGIAQLRKRIQREKAEQARKRR